MKTETKHTPKIWEVFEIGKNHYRIDVMSAVESSIATINPNRYDAQQNAQLIAAAPELLEALQNFIDAIDIICESADDAVRKTVYQTIKNSLTYQVGNAAINKALGNQ